MYEGESRKASHQIPSFDQIDELKTLNHTRSLQSSRVHMRLK